MSPRPPRQRRSRRPGQGMLLGAAALLMVGGFLPWLYTPIGEISGFRGPGRWTFYVGLLALAGGMIPRPRLAAAQGLLAGVVAVVLPVWQVVHMLTLVGTQAWYPGPGLVVTAGGGVLALNAARTLWRGQPDD